MREEEVKGGGVRKGGVRRNEGEEGKKLRGEG